MCFVRSHQVVRSEIRVHDKSSLPFIFKGRVGLCRLTMNGTYWTYILIMYTTYTHTTRYTSIPRLFSLYQLKPCTDNFRDLGVKDILVICMIQARSNRCFLRVFWGQKVIMGLWSCSGNSSLHTPCASMKRVKKQARQRWKGMIRTFDMWRKREFVFFPHWKTYVPLIFLFCYVCV